MLELKDRFPFFQAHPDLIYLDSAATTQKPAEVIQGLVDFYTRENANAGRGAYPLASSLGRQVEVARAKVAEFIGATEPEEIIFTSGATDSFNQIAYSLAFNYLEDHDEILFNPQDHKSFVYPWYQVQQLLAKLGKTIKLIAFKTNQMGSIDRDDLLAKVGPKTKVLNLTHVHNVYGADSDINLIRDALEDREILINVDATQSVGHINVDVSHLGADLLSFSGHKMFAAQGIGAIFVSKRLHEILKPMYLGGGNSSSLSDHKLQFHDSFPGQFETGTGNYGGILSLATAIDFIDSIGIHQIQAHLIEITQYALAKLREIPSIEFAPGPHFWPCADGVGIISFRLKHVPSAEVGFILAQQGILVRTGDHCMGKTPAQDTIRLSMHIYTTKEDVDALVRVLSSLSI